MADLLVGPLHLSVCLQVLSKGKTDSYSQLVRETIPISRGELTMSPRIPIYMNTCLKRSSALTKAVGMLSSGIRWNDVGSHI